jgi:hypothetical protein
MTEISSIRYKRLLLIDIPARPRCRHPLGRLHGRGENSRQNRDSPDIRFDDRPPRCPAHRRGLHGQKPGRRSPDQRRRVQRRHPGRRQRHCRYRYGLPRPERIREGGVSRPREARGRPRRHRDHRKPGKQSREPHAGRGAGHLQRHLPELERPRRSRPGDRCHRPGQRFRDTRILPRSRDARRRTLSRPSSRRTQTAR